MVGCDFLGAHFVDGVVIAGGQRVLVTKGDLVLSEVTFALC